MPMGVRLPAEMASAGAMWAGIFSFRSRASVEIWLPPAPSPAKANVVASLWGGGVTASTRRRSSAEEIAGGGSGGGFGAAIRFLSARRATGGAPWKQRLITHGNQPAARET